MTDTLTQIGVPLGLLIGLLTGWWIISRRKP